MQLQREYATGYQPSCWDRHRRSSAATVSSPLPMLATSSPPPCGTVSVIDITGSMAEMAYMVSAIVQPVKACRCPPASLPRGRGLPTTSLAVILCPGDGAQFSYLLPFPENRQKWIWD